MPNSPHYGAELFKTGPLGVAGTLSLTEGADGVEPSSVYVPVGGETRVTFATLDLSSVSAVGIPSPHAPTVIYQKETDGSFLVPPALVANFQAVVGKRI